MAEYDLSGLEQAAARAGLPGLSARVVPHDRRRGRWFHWTRDELLVSERVLERLRPADGAVLVLHAVVLARRMESARRRAALWLAALLAVWSATLWVLPDDWRVSTLIALACLLPFVAWPARVRQQADDEAVELLGDAEPLVRALNMIHQDELHIGGLTLDASPDVHARAERLVRIHQLRLPPELRQVPGPGLASGTTPSDERRQGCAATGACEAEQDDRA